MTPKITEEKVAIVGKFYLVPCVEVTADSRIDGYRKGEFVPVVGDLHEDGEFLGFPYQHYHYDRRFIPDRRMPRWGAALNTENPAWSERKGVVPETIVWLKRKCVRQMPDIPPNLCHKLEPHFSQAKLCSDRCPHKGFLLNALPADREGNVVCPGHGLKWHRPSGALVSRIPERQTFDQFLATGDAV